MSRAHPRFCLLTAIVPCIITVWGFTKTYFAPLPLNRPSAFGGQVSGLPVVVHVHGWSFFPWYLLLALQAFFVYTSRVRVHRTIGRLSPGLVAIIVVTGVIVLTANVHFTLAGRGAPIWRLFGMVTFSSLVLFAVFYALALRNCGRARYNRRYMLVASSVALGAAKFRVFLSVLGPFKRNVLPGIVATNLVIVAGVGRQLSIFYG